MTWLNELWRRLNFLFRRARLDEDLAEEMRLHLDLRAAQRTGDGADPRDAEMAARRQFGNPTQLRESSREVWGWSWLDSLVRDIRYGVRTLAANPGFTLIAVLSLALGIGANTAMFSILNAVILRSLPVEDPQRLVQVGKGPATNPIWEQIRDHQQAFSGSLAYSEERFDLTQGGEVQLATGMFVSGDFFRVLGVAALRGRVFSTEDDRRGGGKAGPVAVISYKFWKSHFAGDPATLGKTVSLDRHKFEIVGITPPWFKGLDIDHGYDVAIPIGCEPIVHTDRSALDHRSWWWLHILGRLGPATSLQQAQAKMDGITPELNRTTVPLDWDAPGKQRYLKRTFLLAPAATGFSSTRFRYRKALWTLTAVVALVLLIACANIANLLLARAGARQREISVRLAIGAGRPRVIRQLLTESLLLAVAGAAGGLLFARWGSGLLVHLMSNAQNPLEVDVSPDARVLGFTMAIAVVTSILFGLAPAFRATGLTPSQILKEHARGSVAGSSRFNLGKLLVAGQVALSLLLLVAAGLFLGTMRNLLGVNAGFDPRNVLLIHVDTLAAVPKAGRADTYQEIVRRLSQVPGVVAAASSLITPLSHSEWDLPVYPDGYPVKSPEDTDTYFNRVSPGFFETFRTPLVTGRNFTERDTLAAPRVMIINEAAARKFFGASNPIGRTISMSTDGPAAKPIGYEVVGVTRNAKYLDLGEEPHIAGYLPMAQDVEPYSEKDFEVRYNSTLEAVAPAVRAAIVDLNPGISLQMRSFETQVSESLGEQRIVAMLCSFFAALALLLAMIGLYGVTSYAVMRRRGEIGMRMALGATPPSVIWLILRDVAVTLSVGAVLGVAASLAAGRLVTSMLYGVKAADARTIVTAVIVLATATALAGYLPARRASRLDPIAALRDE